MIDMLIVTFKDNIISLVFLKSLHVITASWHILWHTFVWTGDFIRCRKPWKKSKKTKQRKTKIKTEANTGCHWSFVLYLLPPGCMLRVMIYLVWRMCLPPFWRLQDNGKNVAQYAIRCSIYLCVLFIFFYAVTADVFLKIN